MPLQWRLQVLEAQMRARFDEAISFVETDLFRLVDAERTAALDALMGEKGLPFAILDDEVVCSGALDANVIAGAIKRHLETR